MTPILFILAAAGLQTTAPPAPAPTPAPVSAPAPAAAPSAEAEALGVEVAKSGLFVTLLPAMTPKEIDDIVKEHPELTAADKDALRAAGDAETKAVLDKLVGVMGHEYAKSMSVEDMKAVIAFGRSEASKRWHAAEPAAMAASLKQLDGFDFKARVSARLCKSNGKLCPATEKK
jgi:hypothetical protein